MAVIGGIVAGAVVALGVANLLHHRGDAHTKWHSGLGVIAGLVAGVLGYYVLSR